LSLPKVLVTIISTSIGATILGLSKGHLRSLQSWPNPSTHFLLQNVSRCCNLSTAFYSHQASLLCRALLVHYQINSKTPPTAQCYQTFKFGWNTRSAFERYPTDITRRTTWSNRWLVQYHICVRQQHSSTLVQRKRDGDIRGMPRPLSTYPYICSNQNPDVCALSPVVYHPDRSAPQVLPLHPTDDQPFAAGTRSTPMVGFALDFPVVFDLRYRKARQ
jgi:hypothetical protein